MGLLLSTCGPPVDAQVDYFQQTYNLLNLAWDFTPTCLQAHEELAHVEHKPEFALRGPHAIGHAREVARELKRHLLAEAPAACQRMDVVLSSVEAVIDAKMDDCTLLLDEPQLAHDSPALLFEKLGNLVLALPTTVAKESDYLRRASLSLLEAQREFTSLAARLGRGVLTLDTLNEFKTVALCRLAKLMTDLDTQAREALTVNQLKAAASPPVRELGPLSLPWGAPRPPPPGFGPPRRPATLQRAFRPQFGVPVPPNQPALRADGVTPLPAGYCNFVVGGQCTRGALCRFPHDYGSFGRQYSRQLPALDIQPVPPQPGPQAKK